MVELKTNITQPKTQGQAMVEYALIIVLVAIAFGVTLAATGPAIGNVFCNVVNNIGGTTADPRGGTCGDTAPDLYGEGGDPELFWKTVTWVAAHPQQETPFPTPIHRAPTSVNGGISNSPTPSATPSNTATPTFTATPTNSATPSPGPSPTNSDMVFTVPFVDQIDNPQWWRLDLADIWNVQWYGNHSYTGTVSSSSYRTINFSQPKNATTLAGGDSIDFAFGTGSPPSESGVTGSNNYAARFTRTFFLAQDTTYDFSILADDEANFYLDDSTVPFFWSVTWNVTRTGTFTIPAGMHTLTIDYAEDSGGAYIHFSMTPTGVSGPVMTVSQDNSCTWGRSTGTNDPSSILWQFDENPSSDTWTAGQTCYLEMRGYVDLTGHSNPIYTYWDIWDFTGAGNVTAELQVSNYVDDGSGGLDRSALSWQTIATRSAGTSNYNWTRSQIPLRSVSGLGDHVTFRYVIGSSTGGTPFRWYIDDIQVLDAPASSSYTVGNEWNLDNRSQMDNFIFDADSNRTLEKYPALPDTIDGWRWDLTSTNVHSGSGAWDDSPGGNYQGHSQGGPRVHYLEFNEPIDLTTTRSPAVPAADNEGDTGVPLLSFWQAYDVQDGASLRVQYTRDNINDSTPDTWTDVPGGILLDYTAPAGVPRTNEQTLRTNLTMQPIEIDLTQIPNWDTSPFRLRFALYVNSGVTTFGDGWYIDDIKLERENASPYIAYPFFDDAEDSTYATAVWQSIGNSWGQTTEVGGVNSSATAYSDSPSSNYAQNTTHTFEMKNYIDLLNDSANNATDSASRPAAVNPILTFWHRRYLGTNVTFNVDVKVASTGGWTTVWSYDSNADTTLNRDNAWDRIEINLVSAVQTINSDTWANIASNGVDNDDDIKIRFSLTTGSSTARDGVYVDNISIGDAPNIVHNLWQASGGDGSMIEQVEYSINMNGGYWPDHWYAGGDWGSKTITGHWGSSTQVLTDSPSGNYQNNQQSMLELIPIVNLTSTMPSEAPRLYFWTRYQIASDDNFQVQIATEDTASQTQGPDKIGGWTAWTTQPLMVGVPMTGDQINNDEIATWERGQVDLSSFIGKRIRVRFVLYSNNTNRADGIYLDDIAFTFGPSALSVPFTDTAQATANWVTEGIWGLGKDAYVGSGANTDIFGPTQWSGTYFDCDCYSTTFQNLLDSNSNYAQGAPLTLTGPKIGPSNVSEIDYDWGSGTLPMGTTDTAYYDGFTARWNRQVTLLPGTYYFRTISDDGIRLIISDTANTTGTAPVPSQSPKGYIIDNWTDHGPYLDTGILTVTGSAPITRTLTLEFYENGGGAVAKLRATSTSYSFTDSPNSYSGGSWTTVDSVYPGNSSLILDGYFNLASSASTPTLTYKVLYDLPWNNIFRAEYSTDGGFTWTQGDRIDNATRTLNSYTDWLTRTVTLPTQDGVMIRFRLDTRGSGGTTGDGIFIADVNVKN